MRDADISPFRAAFLSRPAPAGSAPSMPPQPRGSRRPHADGKVAQVRRLIEETTLTYGEIAARTGVGRASICRWTRDAAWKRPLFAPRATDTVPSFRASAKLKRRTLSARVQALAERHIAELEASANVDADRLEHALTLLTMAKLAARPRKPRSRGGDPLWNLWVPQARDRVIADLRAAGVDIARTPNEILDDFLTSSVPERDSPALHERGRRSRRVKEHKRMLGRE
jgi:hypothetical protein